MGADQSVVNNDMDYYEAMSPFSWSKKLVGAYFGGWTSLDKIDAKLLDVAYFSFFDISSDGTISSSYSEKKIRDFINLKNQNSSIKLIAAIGGWNAGTTEFSKMANNATARSNFVNKALNLTTKYGFDGIDIDWEFPVIGGAHGETSQKDKSNLNNVLTELKYKLSSNGKILTIAVTADSQRSSQAYDIKKIAENVDMVNIMTYDYGSKRGEHNAPFDKVNSSVQYWIDRGCPANKLVLGLAAYGWKYGNIREEISYRDIVQEKNYWNQDSDNEKNPSGVSSNNAWITYDSPKSIQKKMEIVKNKGLLGCFFWSSHQDDYDASGSKETFPLIRTAYRALDKGEKSIIINVINAILNCHNNSFFF